MNGRICAFIAGSACALLAACAHGGGGVVPSTQMQGAGTRSAGAQTVPLAGVTRGNFTEYALPAKTNPTDLTRGPYNTVWFTGLGASGNGTLNQLDNNTNTLRVLPIPPPNTTGPNAITGAARQVWFITNNLAAEENPEFMTGTTPEHAFTFFGIGFDNEQTTNISVGPDNRLWSGACIQVCGDGPDSAVVSALSTTGVSSPGLRLSNFMNAVGITPGPGGLVYATATNDAQFAAPTQESAVLVITTAPTLLQTFDLPSNANPGGIAACSDHNLWVTEPGINKMARMTPSGTITQYAIPTANAGAAHITSGPDNALWFTESNANKLGRLTTDGSFTEYSIPTAGSQPMGIQPCTTFCGTHGGVWFTETGANKIAKFNAPV